MSVFILVALISFGLSYVLNTFLLKFSSNLGIRNNQVAVIRFNKTTKPSLGGISMYFIFLFSFIFSIFYFSLASLDHSIFLGLFLATTLAFLVGFYDDAYNTKPFVKFTGQFLCASILVFLGISIDIFESVFLNILMTYIWVIGMMNSLNMLDNMDAITTVTSIIVLVFSFAINPSFFEVNPALFLVGITVVFCLLAFLFFNWHPSKMFMGDTGSQFLGLFLSFISIDSLFNIPIHGAGYFQSKIMPFIFIGMIFIIPLTDTITVSINRIANGKSPFIGGRDHTTHFLYYLGFKEPVVVSILIFIQILSSISALIIYHIASPSGYLFLVLPCAGSLFLFLNTQKKWHNWFKYRIFNKSKEGQVGEKELYIEKIKNSALNDEL